MIDRKEQAARMQPALFLIERSSSATPASSNLYELTVDCTGKFGPAAKFPSYQGLRNAPDAPLRVCSAGIFHGIEPDGINHMNYNILPGLGEMFETTTMTANGLARMILHEAVAGGEMDLSWFNYLRTRSKRMKYFLHRISKRRHRDDKSLRSVMYHWRFLMDGRSGL